MRRKDLHKRTRDLGPNDLAALAAWVAAKRDPELGLVQTRAGEGGVFRFRIPADIYGVADKYTAPGTNNPLRGVTLEWPYDPSSPVRGSHVAHLYSHSVDNGYQAGVVSPDNDAPLSRTAYKCAPGRGVDTGYLMLVVTVADAEKAPLVLTITFNRHNSPLLELPDP